ncbi:uncharacterized protein LOC144521776 isoform X4 [Sander vitreus]
MTKVQMLRALVEQRLTAAAEEIFGLFERTIAEYEEELCRSKEENERQQKLLDAVFNPQLRLHRAELPQQHVCKEEEVHSDQELNMPVITSVVSEANSDHQLLSHNSHDAESQDQKGGKHGDSGSTRNAEPEPKKRRLKSRSHRNNVDNTNMSEIHADNPTDIQQLLVVKAEVPPEQKEWSSSLNQEDPEPPHIKEEQEELWTSQEGEQLQGLEEADIKFPFTSVPVKSEEDEEKAQSSQLHESQTEENREAERTEADGENCGEPEPARNSDPDSPLQPATHDKTSYSSESETNDRADWEETRELQSGLNPLQKQ